MKVTSVEMHPAGSSSIAIFSFRDPKRNNPYNIKSIVGLDADEIVPRYYGSSGSLKFYNLALEKRSIVIRVELNPNFGIGETHSYLRDELYKAISSSRTALVSLHFIKGTDTIAAISGFVSKFEASHFTKTPEVQITLQCNDPMLRSLEATEVDTSELDPEETHILDELSTAPHGFRFAIKVLDDLDSFTIGHDVWSFSAIPADGFEIDDVIHLSSVHNDRYLYVVRDSETIHIADSIVSGSIWPIIFPGDNTFICDEPEKLSWETIEHFHAYWGV